MDLTKLEPYIMDEWIFIPVVLLIALWAFGSGFIIGSVWASLL
jgi:hypothetical protein